MSLFISTLVSAVIQVILLSLVPFIWWLIFHRKKESFFSFVGIKKPDKSKVKSIFIAMIGVLLVCEGLGIIEKYCLRGFETADSTFSGMGISAIGSVIVYAFVQTAFSEEIFFRGFLLKRLSAKLGLAIGSKITAVIFGAMHVALVYATGRTLGIISFVTLLVYPMVVSLLLTWVNEKKANGSILPGWFIHGIINLIEGIGKISL